jgi:hypothetical protein
MIWPKDLGSQYGEKKRGRLKKQQYDLVKRIGKSIWWGKKMKRFKNNMIWSKD